MAKVTFNPNTVAKSADINANFAGTWNGTFLDSGSILTRHLADGAIYNPGDIKTTLNSTIPTGWLYADGSAVSRTTYAALFAALGTQFGAGNGTTTFNLPNLKGAFLVGYDSTQGEFVTIGHAGGAKYNDLTHSHSGWTDGAGWHGHRFTTNSGVYQGGQASNVYTSPTGWVPPGHNHDGYTDGEGNHAHNVATNPSLGSTNNMPPYISVNYLVHI